MSRRMRQWTICNISITSKSIGSDPLQSCIHLPASRRRREPSPGKDRRVCDCMYRHSSSSPAETGWLPSLPRDLRCRTPDRPAGAAASRVTTICRPCP
jgi:hypothetical protein